MRHPKHDQILHDYLRGDSKEQIARRYNCMLRTVSLIGAAHGLPPRPRGYASPEQKAEWVRRANEIIQQQIPIGA